MKPHAAPSAHAPLSVRDLCKSYTTHQVTTTVVNGLSFTLQRGECYGLLGPNGAGKTTTLRCCLGLTAPDAGTIHLAGLAVPEHAREARFGIGVVPQFDNLDPDFTVAENLLVYGRYYGLPTAAVQKKIGPLLAFAGLAGKENVNIRALSGGMKRRLTLARALVNDPDLLVLDEPTTGLDPQARHLIWQRLKELLAQGKTILLTTHFMEEAERLCDRLAIIDHGRMISEGSPRDLILQHIEAQVVEVYGENAPDWAASEAQAFAQRIEVSGETAFCYVTDATALLAHLADRPGLRALHRPASLEDVFLKLTGRDLRD
jgi:lipooligosaccharide transport system ATP-binding protein